jgi:hypothetical protein
MYHIVVQYNQLRESEHKQGDEMRFQHLTQEENIQKIKDNGFSLEFVGQNGGDDLGTGIYLTQNPEIWRTHLQDHSLKTLEVDVEMDNIINYSDIDLGAAREWMIENGYLTGEEKSPEDLPEKTRAIFDAQGDEGGFRWLTAQYLKDEGYDGYWYRDEENRGYFEQLVVWNLDSITKIK